MSLLDNLDGNIEEEKSLSVKVNPFVEELYFATYDLFKEIGSIWRYYGNGVVEFVAQRPKKIRSLCSHDGILYDSGEYNGIFVSMDDSHDLHPIRESAKSIYALCSHESKLYYATENETFEFLPHQKSDKRVAFSQRHYTTALCSHDDVLYDAGTFEIFETFEYNNSMTYATARRKYHIRDLCSHEGKLYDLGFTNGHLYETLKDRKGKNMIKSFDTNMTSLCSHQGNLYVAGNSPYVFNAFTEKVFFKTNQWVTAMCSHMRLIE